METLLDIAPIEVILAEALSKEETWSQLPTLDLMYPQGETSLELDDITIEFSYDLDFEAVRVDGPSDQYGNSNKETRVNSCDWNIEIASVLDDGGDDIEITPELKEQLEAQITNTLNELNF